MGDEKQGAVLFTGTAPQSFERAKQVPGMVVDSFLTHWSHDPVSDFGIVSICKDTGVWYCFWAKVQGPVDLISLLPRCYSLAFANFLVGCWQGCRGGRSRRAPAEELQPRDLGASGDIGGLVVAGMLLPLVGRGLGFDTF